MVEVLGVMQGYTGMWRACGFQIRGGGSRFGSRQNRDRSISRLVLGLRVYETAKIVRAPFSDPLGRLGKGPFKRVYAADRGVENQVEA